MLKLEVKLINKIIPESFLETKTIIFGTRQLYDYN